MIVVEMLLVTQLDCTNSLPNPLNFVGQGRLTSTPEHYGTCCYCHVKLRVRLLDVVKQTAVKEGLNAADGPNIVLVFPSLDEGNEPGGVQM